MCTPIDSGFAASVLFTLICEAVGPMFSLLQCQHDHQRVKQHKLHTVYSRAASFFKSFSPKFCMPH